MSLCNNRFLCVCPTSHLTPSMPEYMQCFVFLCAGTNFSFFLSRFARLLTAQRFQNKSLKFFTCFFFSYTLAYDTMSVKFDFVLWCHFLIPDPHSRSQWHKEGNITDQDELLHSTGLCKST